MLGFRLIKVDGNSMAPDLPEGSFILFRKSKTYKVSDIVLVAHPEFGPIIKRICSVQDGRFEIEGTSPLSTSREKLGIISVELMLGRAMWCLPPKIKLPK